jgi:hypothetical protein
LYLFIYTNKIYLFIYTERERGWLQSAPGSARTTDEQLGRRGSWDSKKTLLG